MHAAALADHDQTSSVDRAAAALKIASTEGMLQTVVGVGHGVADLVESASWAAPDDWMYEIRRRLAKGHKGAITGHVPTLYDSPRNAGAPSPGISRVGSPWRRSPVSWESPRTR